MSYDVVVVGAGPIGITTACTIKALNPNVNICVLDKRKDPTRNHGLKINADSVDYIKNSLNMAQGESENLGKIFEGWRGQFIRTVKIEEDLANEARRVGIAVLRGKEYEVEGDEFERDIFQNAQVVIGADGAHSAVRKAVMENRLTDQETLRHLIELKYQTDGAAKPRGYFEASSEAVQHGKLDFESMNKSQTEGRKPVTLHVFVDEPTFSALREVDEKDNLKGVFGNSWTLEEIEKKAQTDEKVKSLYKQFQTHLKGIQSRGGGCYDAKISTLVMDIFRSEKCYKEHKGKHVLLVGDSESGIVLEGGFNKGLKGAAECAQHVANFFFTHDPAAFTTYQGAMQGIFEKERAWAKTKNSALQVAETSVYSSYVSSQAAEETSSSCILL